MFQKLLSIWCPLAYCDLMRVPWTAGRSNQSILKEISPEYSLEGLPLKLKLQYFSHLMRKADSLEKILMLGKIEGWRRGDNRGWDGWMALLTQWTWVWASSRSWWWTGKPGVLQSMGLQRVRHDWVTELIYTKSYTKYFRCIFFFISSLYQMHKVNFHRRYCWTSYQVSISLPYFLIELQLLKVSTFLLCNLHLRKTVLSLSLGMELIDIRIIPLQQVVTSSAMWGLLNPGQWDMKESRLGVCEMILWS